MKKMILKYSIFSLFVISLIYFFKDTYFTTEKSDSLLNLLISTISITLAILVTFFFSKLFSEKQERVQRKSTIDEYSHLITALRRISFNIRSDHKFWSFSKTKTVLDSDKYKNFTIEGFRKDNIGYDQYLVYVEDMGGEVVPQAYLALRGLENNEPSAYEFYKGFKIQNYSLDEISNFKEYCLHFSYFLTEKSDEIDFSNTSPPHLNQIKKDLFLINKQVVSTNDLLKELNGLYSEFSEKLLPEIYYLTELNERPLPSHFTWLSVNLVIYVIMVIVSVITYATTLQTCQKSIIVLSILVFFCINTVDLIIGLFLSIRHELKIKDFYKI
jgi:hypothetical protein